MSATGPNKRFAVVSAVYGVARYLPDYFRSLESQTMGVDALEVVLVDDGSVDGSRQLCDEFAARHPGSVTVVEQANAGQAAARTHGIDSVTAPWVTFIDPDDAIEPDYFTEVARFMDGLDGENVKLFAAHHLVKSDATGQITDTHYLAHRFRRGNRVIDLDAQPDFIQLHVTSAFFRTASIRDHDLSFDSRLPARFEDCKFVAEYLLAVKDARVGLVDSAHYLYRRRDDNSSSIDRNKSDPRIFTDLPRYGHIDLLRTSKVVAGRVPHWVQNVVLYDLFWLFKNSQHIPTRAITLLGQEAEGFLGSLNDIARLLDESAIDAFRLIPVDYWMRQVMVARITGVEISPVNVGQPDDTRKIVPLRYIYTGDAPTEEVFASGRPVPVFFETVRDLSVAGIVVARERVLWVSSLAAIEIRLDGSPAVLTAGYLRHSAYRYPTSAIRKLSRDRKALVPVRFQRIDGGLRPYLRSRARAWRASLRAVTIRARIVAAFTSLLIKLPWVRRRYLHAWVFMDRDTDANDSAEVLYRWVRANQPSVKAWFVVRRSAPDWKRLKRDRFRLASYGSLRWRILMLLASHVASSHADRYVVNPLPRVLYGPPQWKYTFLQHGVVKGDISGWLNVKSIDLFITSTEDEYRYITGESYFKFGPKEVRLAGLPRFDDLLAQDRLPENEHKRYVLVMPTWRDYLIPKAHGQSSERHLNADFMGSEYAQSYVNLFKSERLRAAVREAGLTLVFMPHPLIQPYLPQFELPPDVEVVKYADVDVRSIIVKAAAMITDYSSIAFNMAYLYRPVVYFQFDREKYQANHTERPGYFDYRSHGFGPVVESIAELEIAVESILRGVPEEYQKRMSTTFPVRDGGNARRVYEAMRGLGRSVPKQFPHSSVPLDSWESLTAQAPDTPRPDARA